MCETFSVINESKDRKSNPYYIRDEDISLEDDYSEESNADSVCKDNLVNWTR